MVDLSVEKTLLHETFGHWLTSNKVLGRKLLSVAGVVGLLVTLHGLQMLPPLATILDLPRLLDSWNRQLLASKNSGSAFLHLFQALVCLILVVLTREPSEEDFNPLRDTSQAPASGAATKMPPLLRFKERIFPNLESIPLEGAYRSYVRIHVLLSAVFGTWFLYYFTVGIAKALLSGEAVESQCYFFATTFDVWNSVALFSLYIELSNITVRPEQEVSEGDEAHRSFLNARAHRWLSLLIGVATTLAAFILAAPAAHASNVDFWRKLLSFLCSSFAGVSFALVVGCMSRRRVNPGPVFLATLYFYAMLQLTGVSFTDHQRPWMEVAATSLALPLKALFWLVFMWSFQTGRMLSYVRETRAQMGAAPRQVQEPARKTEAFSNPPRNGQ